MAKAVAVYIGKPIDQRLNLEFGLEQGAWGFPKPQDPAEFAGADYVLFAWNFHGNIRSLQPTSGSGEMDLLLVRTDANLYESRSPLWPDEVATGAVRYTTRIGLAEVVGGAHSTVGRTQLLTPEIAKALSLLTTGGIARSVDVDPSRFSTPPSEIDIFEGASGSYASAARKVPGIKPGNGPGRQRDAKRRMATEERSLVVAEEHLANLGATGVTRVGKPYDIRFLLDGEEIHAEVKGTTGAGMKVNVTRNEVTHAGKFPTWLMVVRDIKLTGPLDDPAGEGGQLRVWRDWIPAEGALEPSVYDYYVPWQDAAQ